MQKIIKVAGKLLLVLLVIWGVVTIIVEARGPQKTAVFGETDIPGNTALFVYDPDPFYNLDEQIGHGFANGLVQQGWLVKVVSVAAAERLPAEEFDLYIFCANTYNWAPDWAITNFIEKHRQIEGKPVIAITLGGGSTWGAQRIMERMLERKNVILLDSRHYWLWRPNDESRLDESNVEVAVEMATELGVEIGGRLKAL